MKLFIEEQSGKIQASVQRTAAWRPEPYGESVDFYFPISAEELEDLRWYLEDYLSAPYAVWEEKGDKVQEKLKEWGTRLFETIFVNQQSFRDAYIESKAKDDFQIWISSYSAEFLGLPWELMYDPELKNHITLSSGGIHRTIPAKVEPESIQNAEQLRVLMVISRPGGAKDVPYQMIARQLIQRIELISGKVELEVLRPPTFQTLKHKIAEAAETNRPYDVLHFDGHGSFGSGATSAQTISPHLYQAPEGYLVFEKENGERDPISADSFALEVKNAKIPLFVFNACKSGQLIGATGPEAAVVTRLIQQGAASAVAMGFSVYAVAAAEFMTMFYEALFAGRSVADAVQEGRRQMHLKNQRPSPKGQMLLKDWLVPVHYARKELSFPQLKKVKPASPESLIDTLEKYRENRVADIESERAIELLKAECRFFGRDAELYQLERAFSRNGVVIAHGIGGTGKTEVAKAFARWLQVSGGLSDPSLVFVDFFEPGLPTFGLSQLLSSFGLRIMGPAFTKDFPTMKERRHIVLKLLEDHRILWIWDNFETVCSLHDASSACRLDENALSELKGFLYEVQRKGQVGILITSRSSEQWLSNDIPRIEIGGLQPQDASLYADDLLTSRPKANERRKVSAFGDLMSFLDGHPLSMRLTLPHLGRIDAQALLDGLRGQGEFPAGFEGGQDRLASLGACVHYSFRHLPQQDQQRLLVLSLFEGVVDINALYLLSRHDMSPKQFKGVTKDDWEKSLERCSDAGLLTPLGGIYRMHPALPGFLTALWKKEAGSLFEDEHEQALVAFIHAHAQLGSYFNDQIARGDAETVMSVLFLEKTSFLRMMEEALNRNLYAQAQAILQPVDEIWGSRGLYAEARDWVDRLRELLEAEDGTAPDLGSKAGALWLFATGSDAIRTLEAGDLETAEKAHDDIRKTLEKSDVESAKKHLATSYHELGMVAQLRGKLDAAESWYKKSLEIFEALGDRPNMAKSYHQLGRVAQLRGKLDPAESWYKKSLEIFEALGNRPVMAKSYHQLGMVAQQRGKLDAAESWYKKSLEIKEALGDRPGMATSYGQLGMVAQQRGKLDAAESWYKKSLEIFEALGNRPGMATSYHQQGMVAQLRGKLDAAESWYKKSLEIFEALGNRPGMATSYHQLGMVMKQDGCHPDAFSYFLQAYLIFANLEAPGVQQALSDICKVAVESQDRWQGWLEELVVDKNSRSQLERLILENMK